jgi:hypothetical protein
MFAEKVTLPEDDLWAILKHPEEHFRIYCLISNIIILLHFLETGELK